MKKKHPISKTSHVGVEFGANLITILAPCAVVWAATVKLGAVWSGLLTGVVGVLTTIFVSKIHEGLHFLWWKWKETQTAWWIYGSTTTNSFGDKVHVIGTFHVVDPSPSAELTITGKSHEFETSADGQKLKSRIDWQATFAGGALLENDFLIVYKVTHDYTDVGYQHGLFWLYHPNPSIRQPLNNLITDFHTGKVQSIDQQVCFDHVFAAKINRSFPKTSPNNDVDDFLRDHAPAIVDWLNHQ